MASKVKEVPKMETAAEVRVAEVVEMKPPILVGAKTSEIVREALRMQQQAGTILAAQEVTLREAHDLPDSWRLGMAPDGTVVLKDTAAPAAAQAGSAPSEVEVAAIKAAEAKRLNRNERRRAQRVAEKEAKAVAASAAIVAA